MAQTRPGQRGADEAGARELPVNLDTTVDPLADRRLRSVRALLQQAKMVKGETTRFRWW